MHCQQSGISEVTWQEALMSSAAHDGYGSQAKFKPFNLFKQFKSLNLQVRNSNPSGALAGCCKTHVRGPQGERSNTRND
jgi:hypothetical protein